MIENLTLLERLAGALPLAIVLFSLAWLMRRLHHDQRSPIRLTDLVIRNGKLDLASCAFIGLFVLNVWAVVYTIVSGKAAEGASAILAVCNGALAAPVVAKAIFGPKAQQPDKSDTEPKP